MPAFVTRVRIKDFKSVAKADVSLGPLTFLVGANGSGKSNFLDALRLVSDCLRSSLDHALRERGGIQEVRRRSGGHPRHFQVSLEFVLTDGTLGRYGFAVGARKPAGFIVTEERCEVGDAFYEVRSGQVRGSSEAVLPPSQDDRLYLVAASGLPAFRPAYDALSRLLFYNLDPSAMREPQPPDSGELLRRNGSNLASVLDRLDRTAPTVRARVEEFLGAVVPGIEGVHVRRMGHLETVDFRQRVADASAPWRFPAINMSDGTLRALGVLVALHQVEVDPALRLVGIEEPEVALHPAAQHAIVEALRHASRRVQVLVTSHSPDILDDERITPDEIRAVVATDGVTEIGNLDGAGRKALNDHLFTPGELLRTQQLEPDQEQLAAVRGVQLPLFAHRERRRVRT